MSVMALSDSPTSQASRRLGLGAREIAVSGLLAGTAIVTYYVLPGSEAHVDEVAPMFFRTTATIAATLLGFVFTGLSITLVVIANPFFARLRATGHTAELWVLFRQVLSVLATSVVISLAGIVFPGEPTLFFLVIGFVTFSGCGVYHVVRVVLLLARTSDGIASRVERSEARHEKARKDREQNF